MERLELRKALKNDPDHAVPKLKPITHRAADATLAPAVKAWTFSILVHLCFTISQDSILVLKSGCVQVQGSMNNLTALLQAIIGV